jgi:hypothetical protein
MAVIGPITLKKRIRNQVLEPEDGSSGNFVGRESGFLVLSNAVLVLLLVLEAPKSQRFFSSTSTISEYEYHFIEYERVRKKPEAYPTSHNNSSTTRKIRFSAMTQQVHLDTMAQVEMDP